MNSWNCYFFSSASGSCSTLLLSELQSTGSWLFISNVQFRMDYFVYCHNVTVDSLIGFCIERPGQQGTKCRKYWWSCTLLHWSFGPRPFKSCPVQQPLSCLCQERQLWKSSWGCLWNHQIKAWLGQGELTLSPLQPLEVLALKVQRWFTSVLHWSTRVTLAKLLLWNFLAV